VRAPKNLIAPPIQICTNCIRPRFLVVVTSAKALGSATQVFSRLFPRSRRRRPVDPRRTADPPRDN